MPQDTATVSVVNLPQGYSVESIKSGSQNLLTGPLVRAANASPSPIEVVLRYARPPERD
jgi:hypothetical protein